MSVNKHNLVFLVPPSEWQESFPIGNGVLGATVYQPRGHWEWVINHLDVLTSPYHLSKQEKEIFVRPLTDDEIKRRALEAHADESNPAHQDYNVVFGDYGAPGARRYSGIFDPVCGTLQVHLDRDHAGSATSSTQELSLASGIVRIEERCEAGSISCETFASCNARCILLRIDREEIGPAVSSIALQLPRGFSVEAGTDSRTAFVKGYPVEDFSYVLAVSAVEGGGSFEKRGDELVFTPSGESSSIALMVTVATSLDDADPLAAAQRTLEEAGSTGYEAIRAEHVACWEEFWGKSEIDIPDRFLEYLWYLNLYSLASTSGIGAKDPQGCGLYGLWYNAPSRWPNCWYEDVNIEQAYWPVYVSNHLELSQPFVEGVTRRLPIARRQAELRHGVGGASYGYPLMHCIGPWYCQYLWWHYLYSGDEAYLRETAYPTMKEVLAFFEEFLTREPDGSLSVFPSISPEQGPMTKNDTITLASLKYLLRAAIRCTEILSIDDGKRKSWEEMLQALPDYPSSQSKYGEKLLDSEWASPELYLAHSSILMPVYPLRELAGDVPRNTLRYAAENQGTGSHNFDWLAAAAASLGMGDEARRLLYDLGIAYMMVPTGLFVESTERHMQACSVLFPACYCPPLLESGGGTVAVINEMLLQSRAEGIAVFPALPSDWRDASFSRLLAEGAFEISAEMRDGEVTFVEVKSLAGGTCRLLNPWSGKQYVISGEGGATPVPAGEAVIEIATTKGRVYQLEAAESLAVSDGGVGGEAVAGPLSYMTPFAGRVFIGRDESSRFLEDMDRFLFNTKAGAFQIVRATRYKLDFGRPDIDKDYTATVPAQFLFPNKYGPDFERIGAETSLETNYRFCCGWRLSTGLAEVDRGGPDCLRRDFISGTDDAELQVFLTAGSYQSFVVTGDAEEARGFTRITFPDGHVWESAAVASLPGFDTSVVSFVVTSDGHSTFTFSTRPGSCWKVSLLLINQVP